MAEPSLKIVVSGKTAVDGVFAENHIPSTTVSSFVRDTGCIAGINAAPFDPVSGREGEDRAIIGVTVSEGVVVASPAPRYDAIVFYADGSAAIVSQAELVRPVSGAPAVWNAVGGFYAVLKDGRITERAVSEAGQKRHPRSAAGLGDSCLYLLAVDGRRLSSIGATEEEVAFLLQRLGAQDGLNFDGGGSTALALRLPDGSVTVANTPSGIFARERAVASCLGIGNRE
jgi:exopolysaccharide biosynthesis protein